MELLKKNIIYVTVTYIDILIQRYFYIKKERFHKNDTKIKDIRYFC